MGLGFFDDVGGEDSLAKDLEKELANDDEDHDSKMSDVKTDPDAASSEPPPTPAQKVKMELEPIKMEVDPPIKGSASATPPPSSAHPERELSKREQNRLKRKRKDGNAFVGAVASSSASQMVKSVKDSQPVPK